jgi:hypothetical protein
MTLIQKKENTRLLPHCIMDQKRASLSPHVLTDRINFVKSILSIDREVSKETPTNSQRSVMYIDQTT